MVKVLFFASVRDRLGCSELNIELPVEARTVATFTDMVMRRGEVYAGVLSDQRIMIAVNQELANPEMVIEDGDEIAYFPPVTGG